MTNVEFEVGQVLQAHRRVGLVQRQFLRSTAPELLDALDRLASAAAPRRRGFLERLVSGS